MERIISLELRATSTSAVPVRLCVSARARVGIDRDIFKYLHLPMNNLDETGDRRVFQGVCTAEEMSSLPAGAPTDESGGLFRSGDYDKIHATFREANTDWETMVLGAQGLLDELEAADVVGLESAVTLPG